MSKSISIIKLVFISLFISVLILGCERQNAADANMSGVEYYLQKQAAENLFRDGNYAEAIPKFEAILDIYEQDGGVWLLLGRSQFSLKRWADSTVSLEKALELGAFPMGFDAISPNAKDTVMALAQAYAQMGEFDKAIAKLKEAMSMRFGGRFTLGGDELLAPMVDLPAFAEIVGGNMPPDLDQVEGWRFDLRFLRSEMERLHPNLYHATPKKDFDAAFAALEGDLANLDNAQISARVGQLFSLTGNGHTMLLGQFSDVGQLPLLPFQFYLFSDGLYIIDANPGYEEWIGWKIEHFDGMPSEEVFQRIQGFTAEDNVNMDNWLPAYWVRAPYVLEMLGVVDDPKDFVIGLRKGDETTEISKIEHSPFRISTIAMAPLRDADKNPVYLQNLEQTLWSQLMPERNALYVQMNSFGQPSHDMTVVEFFDAQKQIIEDTGAKNLIFDLRHNAGGNGYLVPPVLKFLSWFEATQSDGSIYVLMSRNSFSAAGDFIVYTEHFTNAIFVGEATSTRPNSYAETGLVLLPYSGLFGMISSEFHQHSWPEDGRLAIVPDVPLSLSGEDFFAGRDLAMEALDQLINR